MIQQILWSFGIAVSINIVMFVFAFRLSSDKLTDASYAVTFMAVAVFAFYHSDKSYHDSLGLLLIFLWALRLGGFLLYRVVKKGSDSRFDAMRDSFWKFGRFWLLQGLTVGVLMIPFSIGIPRSTAWNNLTIAGLTIMLFGLIIETVADFQKYRFSLNPKNKNKWIEEGIWRYSRHPNYFGEITVWIGLYLYLLPSLSISGRLVGLISPIAIALLLRYGSGVPLLEKSADDRWGKQAAYRNYKQHTSLMIPLPKNNK